MSMIVPKRLVKSGVTNFFRNIWISIAATSMVTITLFIISTMIILYTLAYLAVQNSTDKIGVVTAYFNQQTTDKEMQNVKQEVEAMHGVREVVYTSQETAIERFKELHKNEPALLASLDEFGNSDNPIPASLGVKAVTLNDYSSIYSLLQGDRFKPYFEKVRDNQKVIDKLNNIISLISKFGLLLALIFFLVTILVTFNTIRFTIYNRREEVEIMRLVGATNWYIRWPFLIEGIMYGIFATILTSLVVWGILTLLSSRIEQFLSISVLGSSLLSTLFWQILVINLATSIILGAVASTIAMRKYLKI